MENKRIDILRVNSKLEVMKLVKIKESNNDVKKEFKVEPIKVYEISNENGVVGYGTINKDDKN